jgi:hypothetical protein
MIQEEADDENNQTQNSMYVTGLGGVGEAALDGTQGRQPVQLIDI